MKNYQTVKNKSETNFKHYSNYEIDMAAFRNDAMFLTSGGFYSKRTLEIACL